MKKLTLLLYLIIGLGWCINAQNYTWTTYYTPPTTFVNGGNNLWMISGNTLIQFDKSARCFNRINIADSIQICNDHQNINRQNIPSLGAGYPFIDTFSYDGQNWGTIPYSAYLASYSNVLNIGGSNYYYSLKDTVGNYYFFYDSAIMTYNGRNLITWDTVNQLLDSDYYFQYDFFDQSPKAFDNNGNLWIVMPSYGILKFNGQNFTLYDSSSLFNVGNSYGTGIFVSPYNNNIFVPLEIDSFPRYYLYNGSTWSYDSLPFRINNNGITNIFFSNNLTYFCTGSGIYNFDGTNYSRVILPAPFDNTATNYTVIVAADNGGNYWIMVNGLLFLFDGTSFIAYPDNQALLASNYVLNQLIDKNGNQWIGYSSSIGEINTSGIHNYTSVTGTNGTMAIDSLGRLWHASGSGVAYFDTSDHQIIDSLNINYISFATDRQNNIWAMTNYGVKQFNGQMFIPVSIPGIDTAYSSLLTCLAVDSSNNKWFGLGSNMNGPCFYGCLGGIIKFDGTSCTKFDSTNSPIPSDIECISVDPQNRIWVGTNYRGVMVYNDTTWTVYDTANSGIAGNKIESFYFKNGMTYITTQDNGTSIFDGANWTNFTRQNAPLDNDCESIIMDGNCNLWIGQECGLVELSGTCGVPAGFKLLQGNVYQPDGSASTHELVYLMQYDSSGNVMKTIESTFTDGYGYYHFITNLSEVYIHALPHTSDTTGGMMPVYEDTSIVQQGATRILMDSAIVTQNIWSVEALRVSGPTILTGVVNDPQGRSVNGIRLFLMTTGQPVATTLTSMDGTFAFKGLSPGLYKIWVDKMGVDNSLAPSVDFLTVNSANAVCELTTNQLRLVSVGINEVSANTIRVYPNPTSGILNVSIQGMENIQVSLVDIMGNELMHTSMSPGTQRLDLTMMEAGVYILRLQSGSAVYMQRVVLSK